MFPFLFSQSRHTFFGVTYNTLVPCLSSSKKTHKGNLNPLKHLLFRQGYIILFILINYEPKTHVLRCFTPFFFICLLFLSSISFKSLVFHIFSPSSHSILHNTMCPGSSDPFYILYVQEVVTHFI